MLFLASNIEKNPTLIQTLKLSRKYSANPRDCVCVRDVCEIVFVPACGVCICEYVTFEEEGGCFFCSDNL